MATRNPFQMPSQNGTANSAVAAGTQPISTQMPGQAVGGRTSPRPPMPMGGGQGGGGQQQAAQPEQRLPIDPNAGGPTSPMNIGPMLQPQQATPGGGGAEKTALPGWGDQGMPQQGQGQGPQGQQATGQFGPAMMLQLMKSMGQI